jgi:hypothetical protein
MRFDFHLYYFGCKILIVSIKFIISPFLPKFKMVSFASFYLLFDRMFPMPVKTPKENINL